MTMTLIQAEVNLWFQPPIEVAFIFDKKVRGAEKSMDEWRNLAEKNGISYQTYWRRVNSLNWDPKIAATKPIQTRKLSKEFKKWETVAKQNNIPFSTFYHRVKKGWVLQNAATSPPQKRKDHNYIELAKANGIHPDTYRSRVDKSFWNKEEAATIPTLSRDEAMKEAREHQALTVQYKRSKVNKDPSNLFTLTPEHFKKAAKLGLSEGTVQNRVYSYGWTVQKAISTPLQKPRNQSDEYYKFLKIATQNGISGSAYYRRVVIHGWSPKEAAETKVKINERTRPDKDWIERALNNGIKYVTYTDRIKRGWTYEEAAFKPPLERGKFLNEETKSKAVEGFKEFGKMKKGGS